MARKLTLKQKKFADRYMETGNGTKAALEAYDTNDNLTARVISSENLTKPNIVDYLSKHVEEMKSIVVELAKTSDQDTVRLNAANSVIDRVEGKALATSKNYNENIEGDLNEEQIDLILKRRYK